MTLSDETKQKIYEDFEKCKDTMYGTLTEKERKKLGAFYTPAQLVIQMIEKFENLEGDICDPCCGNGLLLWLYKPTVITIKLKINIIFFIVHPFHL